MLILLFMGITLFQPQEPVTQTDLKILEDKIQNKIDSQKNDVNAMWNGLDKRVAEHENTLNFLGLKGLGFIVSVAAAYWGAKKTLTTHFEEEVKKTINKNAAIVENIIRGAKLESTIFKTEKILVISNYYQGQTALTLKELGFEDVDEASVEEFKAGKLKEGDYDLLLFDEVEEQDLISLLKPLKGPVYHAFFPGRYDNLGDLKKKLNASNSYATLVGNILDSARYRHHRRNLKTNMQSV